MKRLVYPMLFLGFACFAANTSQAEIRTISPTKFSKSINFDNLQSGTIDDNYVSHGLRFRDQFGSYAQAMGSAPGNVASKGKSAPNAVVPTNGKKGMYVIFEKPVRTVGAEIMCDSKDGSIMLEAYDANGNSLGALSLAALNDAWQFLGFNSTTDVAAVRFYRWSKNGTEASFELDNLGFSFNASGNAGLQ